MKDDIRDIAEYYDTDPERENTRLERHQLEHDLTWCYLNQYLPAHGSILEVGAATGGYTLELAKRGYSITAVDLSAANIELCRKRLTGEGLQGQVRLVLADARDLLLRFLDLPAGLDQLAIGIPFHHDVQRRIDLLAAEGVEFVTCAHVGPPEDFPSGHMTQIMQERGCPIKFIDPNKLLEEFDVLLLAHGTPYATVT